MVVRTRGGLTRPLLVALLLGATAWATALLRLRGDVERRRAYWAVAAPTTDGELLYVALGDSAAQGVGASGPERSYVGLVAERLRRATGQPVRVVNLSRSGATVADVVREQLPRLAQLRPDIVTVAAGGNDVRGYDPGPFRTAVETLLDGLPPHAVVADMPFFGGGRAERAALAAGATLTVAARARGLRVAALHDAMRDRGRPGLLGYAADGFHPNDRGYVLWADALWTALTSEPSLLPAAV